MPAPPNTGPPWLATGRVLRGLSLPYSRSHKSRGRPVSPPPCSFQPLEERARSRADRPRATDDDGNERRINHPSACLVNFVPRVFHLFVLY